MKHLSSYFVLNFSFFYFSSGLTNVLHCSFGKVSDVYSEHFIQGFEHVTSYLAPKIPPIVAKKLEKKMNGLVLVITPMIMVRVTDSHGIN